MSAVKATVGARQADPNLSLAERYHERPIQRSMTTSPCHQNLSQTLTHQTTQNVGVHLSTLMRGLQHVASSYVSGTSMGECVRRSDSMT